MTKGINDLEYDVYSIYTLQSVICILTLHLASIFLALSSKDSLSFGLFA